MAQALKSRRLGPLIPAETVTVRFYNPFFDPDRVELNPHVDKEVRVPSNGQGGVDDALFAEYVEDQAMGVLSRMTTGRRF